MINLINITTVQFIKIILTQQFYKKNYFGFLLAKVLMRNNLTIQNKFEYV